MLNFGVLVARIALREGVDFVIRLILQQMANDSTPVDAYVSS
jgi:hypothetical protein